MVENFNVTPKRLAPLGGAGSDGTRLVSVSAVKVTQNDTITLKGIKSLVAVVGGSVNSSGTVTAETYSAVVSTGVITLTSATTGTVTLVLLVR